MGMESSIARTTYLVHMNDNLSRVRELANSAECLCNLNRNVATAISDHDLSKLLRELLACAITESGAISGAILLIDPYAKECKTQIRIVRGQEVSLDNHENRTLQNDNSAFGTPIWDRLGENKDILLLDYEQTLFRDSPNSFAFNKRFFHRFVAHIPLVDDDKNIGFLVLAWDNGADVQSISSTLDRCRQLADQAIVTLHLTRFANDSKADISTHERRVAAIERAKELEHANELLCRRDRLLKAVTEASTLQLRTPGADTAILESLQLLAEAGDFQRAGILKNVDVSGASSLGYWKVLFEWAAVGFIQQKSTSFATTAWHDLDPSGTFISRLAQGLVVDGQRVGTGIVQAKMMESIDALYTINAPIFVDGTFWGVLALDDCVTSRIRSEGERSAILAAAQMMGLAIDHHDVRQQQIRLERQLNIERETIAIERAEMLERVNQALRRCTRRLLRAEDVPSVIAETIAAAGNLFSKGSIVCSGLVVFNRAQACFELKIVQSDAKQHTTSEAPHPLQWNLLEDMDPWYNIIASDYCCININDRDWLHEEIRNICLAQGSKTVVLMRLVADDHPQGFLFFAQSDSMCPANESMWLCQALAAQVSLSLEIERLTSDASHVAVAEERNRMAREIHDTLAQGFLGIILQLNSAQKHIHDLDYVRTALDNSIHLARENLQEARRSVRMIRGHVSHDRDILPELHNTIRQYEKLSRRSIHFVSNVGICDLSPVDGDTVLRVAGEAIGNSVRHSQASLIEVFLKHETSLLTLQVKDNGVGLPAALPECSHFGIVGMRERAEIAGGTLSLTSSPGEGTVVNLKLPLKKRHRS